MAIEKDNDRELNEEVQTSEKLRFFKQILQRRYLIPFVVVLILSQIALIGHYRASSGVGEQVLSPEVSLGEFQFNSQSLHAEPIVSAIFQIHVSLLGETEHDGRLLLSAHQHKVQQEIEQLLRQAHSQDFEDPSLTELKRQIQTMINEILAKQVVAEILITDLSIDRVATSAASIREETSPSTTHKPSKPLEANWEEKQSG